MGTVYLGIDVCKAVLDVDLEKLPQVANTKAGVRRLLGRLTKSKESFHVVCEATGGYERMLLNACHDAEVPISIVNPKRIRDFANAAGIKAKTDAIDKGVISQFARALPPKPTPIPSPTVIALRELTKRRSEIQKEITQTQQKTAGATLSIIIAGTKKIVKLLKAEQGKIEAEISRIRREDQEINAKTNALITSIKGVGEITAVTLLATLPELGRVNRREIAALAGVAPFNRDSGTKRGKRYINAGRSVPRKALYMASLVAKVHCPKMKAVADRLEGKGKAKKVAMIAVARRMLMAANQIIKQIDAEMKCSTIAKT